MAILKPGELRFWIDDVDFASAICSMQGHADYPTGSVFEFDLLHDVTDQRLAWLSRRMNGSVGYPVEIRTGNYRLAVRCESVLVCSEALDISRVEVHARVLHAELLWPRIAAANAPVYTEKVCSCNNNCNGGSPIRPHRKSDLSANAACQCCQSPMVHDGTEHCYLCVVRETHLSETAGHCMCCGATTVTSALQETMSKLAKAGAAAPAAFEAIGNAVQSGEKWTDIGPAAMPPPLQGMFVPQERPKRKRARKVKPHEARARRVDLE